MLILLYDHTLEGLLSVVFDVYSRKLSCFKIVPVELYNSEDIFSQAEVIVSDIGKANRIMNGLEKKASKNACTKLYYCFLSEAVEKESLIYDYLKATFDSTSSIEENFTLPSVLKLEQVNKKMRREIHRMQAFVRFQKDTDDIYYSVIEPDFNVLPLITDHFERRYADQKWLIYDLKRKYGYFYDLNFVCRIEMDFTVQDTNLQSINIDTESEIYSTLWQNYFNAVNIPERKNMKLHIRHVPKRYWKYLPEKQFL